ncbi:uncharacterized protein LOC112684996 [Sipha flava]|uniref:Uncharacterized protein LOC112684996 n=1 Tax=Sipha flava TaxID=143950 RepID=A0A8B8FP98_9HEMI|nr:uncharacterized protein LOC112684996 [Sipha flava]
MNEPILSPQYAFICSSMKNIAQKQKLSSRVQSIILDTLKLKNDGLTDRNTSKESLLLDRIEENNIVESRIGDITQNLVNKHPVSTVQKSKHPELNVFKTVKSVINSVTAENVNTTVNELSALISNSDVMEKTIDFIFARANIRPESIPMLVFICSSLKNVVVNPVEQHAKPISFKKEVLIRCNQVLQSGIQSDSSENAFTHKKPFTFVGELFNANVLSAHTLLEFLQIVPDKLTNRGLDNTCRLLKAAGKKLEQVYNLKKTIRKLTNMVSNDEEGMYSQRSTMLLKELVNLRDKKWLL